jgi:hypothetical protein
MKRLLILLLVLVSCYAQGQNITQLEYFIDSEPGIGSATSVAVTAAPALDNFKFNVPLTSASSGIHTLYVRVKNASGKWSYTYSHPFVKLAVRTNISRVEYFVDTDPGIGNGTSVPFQVGNALSNLTFSIPVSSLAIGFHTLYVRVKDASGRWSLVQSSPFLKIQAPPNITRVEYYIDTDPGLGNGVSVPITPSPVLTNLNFTVDVAGLSTGNHKLYVRVKNSIDRWSVTHSSTFTVCNQAAPVAGEATSISGIGFDANWSAVTGVTTYQLDVSDDDFATYVNGYEAKAVTGTSASVTGLDLSSTYKYRLRSAGTCISLNSNVITVTTGSCLPPSKPVISISDEYTEMPTLTSSASAGNQWYRNGMAIAGATGNTLLVEEPGVYKVQVTAGDCVSPFSDEASIITTGLESRPLNGVAVYPNPVEGELILYGLQAMSESKLVDAKGLTREIAFVSTGDNAHRASVQQLSPGMYLLLVRNGNSLGYIRFIKK